MLKYNLLFFNNDYFYFFLFFRGNLGTGGKGGRGFRISLANSIALLLTLSTPLSPSSTFITPLFPLSRPLPRAKRGLEEERRETEEEGEEERRRSARAFRRASILARILIFFSCSMVACLRVIPVVLEAIARALSGVISSNVNCNNGVITRKEGERERKRGREREKEGER